MTAADGDDYITLSATDIVEYVIIEIPAIVDIDDDFSVAVPFATLNKLVKLAGKDVTEITFEKKDDDSPAVVGIGRGSYPLDVLNEGEFPVAPEIDDPIQWIRIDNPIGYAEKIDNCLSAVHPDDILPSRAGVCFDGREDYQNIAATDGHRLHYANWNNETIHGTKVTDDYIVPTLAVKSLLALLRSSFHGKLGFKSVIKKDKDIIRVTSKWVIYEPEDVPYLNRVKFITRVTKDHEFPPYNHVIPRHAIREKVDISVKDLNESLTRLNKAGFLPSNKSVVFSFNADVNYDDTVALLGENGAKEVVKINPRIASRIKIPLSSTWVLDVLRILKGRETVTFGIDNYNKPVLLTSDGKDFNAIIAPFELDRGDKRI